MRCMDTGWDEKHEISSEGDTYREAKTDHISGIYLYIFHCGVHFLALTFQL